jgi:hypothetical protein
MNFNHDEEMIMNNDDNQQLKTRLTVFVTFTLSVCFLLSLTGCDSETESTSAPIDMAVADMEVIEDMRVTTIDDRCPDARAGVQILVLYPDRVEAFAQDDVGFRVSKSCTFIAQTEQGAEGATGMAISPEGRFFIVVPEGEEGGSIYIYSNNGEFERKVGPNINLKDASRIWAVDNGFAVWISRNGNLYHLNNDGEFDGSYTPPQQGSSRLRNITDMEYIGEDNDGNHRLLVLFSDQAPQLFAFPNSPIFDGMSAATAVATIETPVGKKLLVSGVVEGTTRGVGQYRHVTSGRMAPNYESTLVYETDNGYGDGKDIVSFEDGFFVLDTGGDGARSPSLNSFNTSGIPQEPNPLNVEGTPIELVRTLIFGGF